MSLREETHHRCLDEPDHVSLGVEDGLLVVLGQPADRSIESIGGYAHAFIFALGPASCLPFDWSAAIQ